VLQSCCEVSVTAISAQHLQAGRLITGVRSEAAALHDGGLTHSVLWAVEAAVSSRLGEREKSPAFSGSPNRQLDFFFFFLSSMMQPYSRMEKSNSYEVSSFKNSGFNSVWVIPYRKLRMSVAV